MIFQEIRQALRLLLKNPGLMAIAGLSIAIGIGVNSALFSVTDALLLRPLAIARPGEVVTVVTDAVNSSAGGVSFPDYKDLREKSRSFTGLAAFQFYSVGLAPSANVQPQMRLGMLVSDNFFSAMGVEPVLGRAFCALLGLALALVGLYGLISYSVSRRTQEIGIRIGAGRQSRQRGDNGVAPRVPACGAGHWHRIRGEPRHSRHPEPGTGRARQQQSGRVDYRACGAIAGYNRCLLCSRTPRIAGGPHPRPALRIARGMTHNSRER
jgi:hypothetical protein